MDPMSDVLASMHVRSFGYARLEASAPWGVAYPAHRASIGMVVQGNCWLTVGDDPDPIPLSSGDCFLMAHGDALALRSDPDASLSPFSDVFVRRKGKANLSGTGPPSIVVGGWFGIDRLSSRPLTMHLPPLILIPTDQAQPLALHATLQQLAHETATSAPGSQVIINRLAEVLFIQMLRAHIASNFAAKTSWLIALNDPVIGAALYLMHNRVDYPWTIEKLAHEVGLSRSAFAHRFRRLVGEAPLEYLTNWRIFKASELLRTGKMKLTAIAQSVGYDSDASFSRVFRRVMQTSPGQYRKLHYKN